MPARVLPGVDLVYLSSEKEIKSPASVGSEATTYSAKSAVAEVA